MEIVQAFIDKTTLEKVREILEPMNLTPEEVLVRFYEFCADPDNTETLKRMIEEWKTADTDISF